MVTTVTGFCDLDGSGRTVVGVEVEGYGDSKFLSCVERVSGFVGLGSVEPGWRLSS